MGDEFAGSDEEEEESDDDDDDDDDDNEDGSDDDSDNDEVPLSRKPSVIVHSLLQNRMPKESNALYNKSSIYCVYFQLPIEKKSKKLLKKQKKDA